MRVTRILDLVVIVLLATVLLMPRPSVTVKPALPVDPERRDRVAELQSALIGHPGDADAALELSNIYLDGHRPDWALATVDGALASHPDDYRLQHLRAIAFADRFEGQPAFEAATRARELCERAATKPPAGVPACGEATQARLALLESTLEAVSRVDMRNQPYLAKERIFEKLHPTYIPKRKPTTARPAPPPPPSQPPPPSPTPRAPRPPRAP